MIGNSGQMKLKGKFPEIGPFKEKKEEKVGLRVETDLSLKNQGRIFRTAAAKGNIAMNAKWRPTDDDEDDERTSRQAICHPRHACHPD